MNGQHVQKHVAVAQKREVDIQTITESQKEVIQNDVIYKLVRKSRFGHRGVLGSNVQRPVIWG